MRGLAIVGTQAGADELIVTASLVHAAAAGTVALAAAPTGPGARRGVELLARAGGVTPDAVAPSVADRAATPFVAARHAGVPIVPAELVSRIEQHAAVAVALVATSGGLLAPLTERYSVRDLVAELGLRVVLAAPAGPDLVNGTLLAHEAATGAGLAVAAVVISRWPDGAGRVLQDERALLAGHLPVPVVSLDARGDAAESWPVGDWIAAPAARAAGDARIALEPYSEWDARAVGDPRATPRPEIMAALLEIVSSEGPMTASRAYSVYNRAGGGRKLTSVARAPLSSALYWLAHERRVLLTRKDEIPWQGDDVVRPPDSAPVRVRELGPRTLEEVPLDEIAGLIRRLRAARGLDEPAALKRAVLDSYGLVRMTARADEYLSLSLDLAA